MRRLPGLPNVPRVAGVDWRRCYRLGGSDPDELPCRANGDRPHRKARIRWLESDQESPVSPMRAMPSREAFVTDHPTDEQRFFGHVEVEPSGCLRWAGVMRGGYGRFWLGSRNVSAHRWAWEREYGPVPEGLEINHLCRNKWCVNADHLEAVTRQANFDYSRERHMARIERGESRWSARLSREDVDRIRATFAAANGKTYGLGRPLARELGIRARSGLRRGARDPARRD